MAVKVLTLPDSFLHPSSPLVSSVKISSVASVWDESRAEAWTWVRGVYLGGDPGNQELGSKESETTKEEKSKSVSLTWLTLWATEARSGRGPWETRQNVIHIILQKNRRLGQLFKVLSSPLLETLTPLYFWATLHAGLGSSPGFIWQKARDVVATEERCY